MNVLVKQQVSFEEQFAIYCNMNVLVKQQVSFEEQFAI
jgi:hypothetical protein